jgi:hypothetical protein
MRGASPDAATRRADGDGGAGESAIMMWSTMGAFFLISDHATQ